MPTDTVSQVPLGRWDVDGLPYGGAARFGGWLGSDVECFDAGLFGISPQEALLMDMQHRSVRLADEARGKYHRRSTLRRIICKTYTDYSGLIDWEGGRGLYGTLITFPLADSSISEMILSVSSHQSAPGGLV